MSWALLGLVSPFPPLFTLRLNQEDPSVVFLLQVRAELVTMAPLSYFISGLLSCWLVFPSCFKLSTPSCSPVASQVELCISLAGNHVTQNEFLHPSWPIDMPVIQIWPLLPCTQRPLLLPIAPGQFTHLQKGIALLCPQPTGLLCQSYMRSYLVLPQEMLPSSFDDIGSHSVAQTGLKTPAPSYLSLPTTGITGKN